MRDELRREVPDFKFHIWLEPLELAGGDGTTLYVRAPEHIRTWVAERYLPLLRAAAGAPGTSDATVEIVGELRGARQDAAPGRARRTRARTPA